MQFTKVSTGAASGDTNGQLKIVRGGNMIINKVKTPLEVGTELVGRYEGSVANKYDEGKLDFKLRELDGTLVIFAETSALKKAFVQIEPGTLVQVIFNGKKAIKGGKTYNDYQVGTATDEVGA